MTAIPDVERLPQRTVCVQSLAFDNGSAGDSHFDRGNGMWAGGAVKAYVVCDIYTHTCITIPL